MTKKQALSFLIIYTLITTVVKLIRQITLHIMPGRNRRAIYQSHRVIFVALLGAYISVHVSSDGECVLYEEHYLTNAPISK